MSDLSNQIKRTIKIPIQWNGNQGIYNILKTGYINIFDTPLVNNDIVIKSKRLGVENQSERINIRNLNGFDVNLLEDATDARFSIRITPNTFTENDTQNFTELVISPTKSPITSLNYTLKQEEFSVTAFGYTNADVDVIGTEGVEVSFVEKRTDGSLVYRIPRVKRKNKNTDGKVLYQAFDITTSKLLSVVQIIQSDIVDDSKKPDGSVDYDKIRKNIIEAVKDSFTNNLSNVRLDSKGGQYELTEEERFLKYSIFDTNGNQLPIINWVRGGELQQITNEIDVLDSIIVKLESPSPTTVELYDEVSLFYTPYLPFSVDSDLSQAIIEAGKVNLTPNFKSDIEENAENVFSNYESFETITGGSGSEVGKKVIDYFLSEKKVKLNTDFTDFTNFVKFSSAEERLNNFLYKVQLLESYTSQSLVITGSSDNAIRKATQLEKLDDDIRLLKASFDDYESHLFNTSGSVYSSSFVSSSENIFAEWPKTTENEMITDGDFASAVSWDFVGSGTGIFNQSLEIYKDGIVSQSISLDVGVIYNLSFDVSFSGLPISMTYNGVEIFSDKNLQKGINTFQFTTQNGNSSNDFIINGTDVNSLIKIDSISIKAKPRLKSSTSSDVITWYNDLLEVAKDYDNLNRDSFRNNTPEYIREDSNSEDYVLFVDMIGVLMDEIWLYGKELSNLYDWNNSVTQGLSEDLSIVLLNMYANNLDVGFSEKDIWEYVLGVTTDDAEIGGLTTDYSFKKQQKETIRRLLTNLPFLLKQKGTRRAIKALVSSYGVPESTLFIREYGTFQTPDGLEQEITELKQHHKLRIYADRNIHISQSDSSISPIKAIELTLEYINSVETVTFFSGSNSSGGGFTIGFKDTGSNATDGDIQFSIFDGTNTFTMSSSIAPFYSGEWTLLIQQTESGSYEILANQFDRENGDFDYQIIANGSIPDGVSQSLDNVFNGTDGFLFGTFDTYNTKFNGYLDELRIWNAELTTDNFTEHTKYPQSIKLDNALEIPSALKIRVDVEQPFRTDFTGSLPNLVFNPQYLTTVSASGITPSDWVFFERQEYISVPNIGDSKQSSNKIRYQVNQSVLGNTLTPAIADNVETINIVTATITQRATQQNISERGGGGYSSPIQMASGRTAETFYRYVDVNGNQQERITVLEVNREPIRNTINYQEGTFEILKGERFFTIDIRSVDSKQIVGKQSKEIIQDVSDINELIIGFSPTQIIDEIIIQHFGSNDLVSEYGDPTEAYTDTYNALQTLVDNFFKNITSNQKSKFFIEYIRNFDKTLFNNIRKFVPEKANLTTAIFIEPHLLDRSKAPRLGKAETSDLANQGTDVEPTYTVTPPAENATLTNDGSDNDVSERGGGGYSSPIQPVTNNGTSGDVITYDRGGDGLGSVIPSPEVIPNQDTTGRYINQSSDVVTLPNTQEELILESSQWDGSNIITTVDKYGQRVIYEVRKYDYTERLLELESLIGAISSDVSLSNKEYVDYIREYNDKKQNNGKLFLIKYPYTGTKPGTAPTPEDYFNYERFTSSEFGFGQGINQSNTIIKDGILYVLDDIEVSSFGVSDSSKTTKSKQTRTIATSPDEDIKLTVE